MLKKKLNDGLRGDGLLHEDAGQFRPAGECADLFDLLRLLRQAQRCCGPNLGVRSGVLAVERRVVFQGFCDGLGMGQVRVLAANLVRGGIDPGLSARPRPTRFGSALRPQAPRLRREILRAVLGDLAEVRADLGCNIAHKRALYQYKSFLY